MIQKYKKIIISAASIITAIFAIIGGLWAFDNHYAKSVQVTKLEIQVVQSLKQYNTQQQRSQQVYQYKNDYRFYQFMYDKLTQEMYSIKRQLRRDPTDQGLQQEYIEISQERQRVKQKMDNLMGKIQ